MSDTSSYFVYRILPSADTPEFSVYPSFSTWTECTYFARAFPLAVARLLVSRLEKKNTPYIYGYVEA